MSHVHVVTKECEMELQLKVDGMTCNSCRLNVIDELEELAGVEEIDLDLATGRLVVRGEQLDAQSISAAVVDAGYRPSPLT
jgi:copper chaperone CopZ